MKPLWTKARIALILLISAGSAFGNDEVPETTVVPEPSALFLGGLCGLFFLLWRKK